MLLIGWYRSEDMPLQRRLKGDPGSSELLRLAKQGIGQLVSLQRKAVMG
jgi:hypothetical protein